MRIETSVITRAAGGDLEDTHELAGSARDPAGAAQDANGTGASKFDRARKTAANEPATRPDKPETARLCQHRAADGAVRVAHGHTNPNIVIPHAVERSATQRRCGTQPRGLRRGLSGSRIYTPPAQGRGAARAG